MRRRRKPPLLPLLLGVLLVLSVTDRSAVRAQSVPIERSGQSEVPRAQSDGPEAPTLEDRPSVFLRALDKITARITEIDIPVGEERRFGSLAISVRYCRTRPPIEPPETYAYLDIFEIRGQDRMPVFSGWMVASSPALNPLEHPVYDVWVIRCSTDAPFVPAGSR